MFTLRGITEKKLKREIKIKGDVFSYKNNLKTSVIAAIRNSNEKC